ncbi:MAG TPA: Gfo/Idh/MocA family oxidoreductase [Phycisphaerae bacterium]|nr:Gfo/Idh/MocA family oxidoreductase [Phycisphaerae bacterium]
MVTRIISDNGIPREKVRYAVVGLGYIAQAAVLPAFAHARENSELTALISDDALKLRKLGKKYRVENLYTYEEYWVALRSGEFDAVYIALPNSMHAEYSIDALREGIHVLCEKPMAVTSQECRAMIGAARAAGRKLMIAYRLHFEEANMEAVRIAQSGKLGDLRFFTSTFSMNVKPGDIRLQAELGGGPLNDIGIYCINAARYLFCDEPEEVTAVAVSCDDRRFREVPEMVAATMRFPKDRVATFLCGFNAGDVSEYRVVGERGSLLVEPAYELAEALGHTLTIGDKTRECAFSRRDQFAPELVHFSECIRHNLDPSPSGEEGLADMLIIEALNESIQTQRPVKVKAIEPPSRPGPALEMRKRPVRKPKLIAVTPPSKKRSDS